MRSIFNNGRAQKSVTTNRMRGFFFIFLIIGCAQKKSDRAPERTVSVNEITNARIMVSAESAVEASDLSDQSFQLASNEQGRGIIRNVNGPTAFNGLLLDLRSSLVGTHEVRLALTPKHVVAFAVIKADVFPSLAKVDQLLSKDIIYHQGLINSGLEKIDLTGLTTQDKLLPLSQVAVSSAGRLKPKKNDVGEDTPQLEIEPTLFAGVTHIVMGQLDTRSRMILSDEQIAKEVFLENSIVGKVISYATLKAQTGIKLRLESEKELLLTERRGNTLNLFRLLTKSTLTPDELSVLNAGTSDVIRSCSAQAAASAGIEVSQCVTVLSFSIPVDIVGVERTKDSEGFETGNVDIRVLTVTQGSQGLILIPENVEVVEVRPDQILQVVDERKVLRPQMLKGKEFNFRRTLQDSPNGFDYAFTGLAGELELVKFEFTENSVKVVRSEPLLITSGSTSVDKEILMEIPAEYVIVTRKGPDGQDLPFERVLKSNYQNPEAIALVDWSTNKIPNVSSPLNYYGLENCFGSRNQVVSDVDSRLKDDGLLNLSVTSTYASSSVIDCAGIEMADYFDRLQTIFSFKERISFKLHTPNGAEEPRLDVPLLAQKKLGFGLFTYNKKKPNAAGEFHLEDTIVNIPALFDFADGKTVTYVIAGLPESDSTDPLAARKREVVVASTERVFNDLNKALREAARGTALERSGDFVKLEIEDKASPHTLGDLDRNYVYYIEKATESPIIGLGASHPNPRSGKVEAASVFLYAGNMTKAVARMKRVAKAEKFRDEIMAPIMLQAEQEQPVPQDEETVDPDTGRVASSTAGRSALASALQKGLPDMRQLKAEIKGKLKLSPSSARNVSRNARNLSRLEYVGASLKRSDLESKLSSRSLKLSRAFESLRADGSFAKASFETQSKISNSIAKSLGSKAPTNALLNRIRKANYCVYEAKPNFAMDNKNEADADDVELLGRMWTSTLAHELGHNFGLRHNFIGSFDVANWKTTESEETTRDYSSIMDYLVNDHNSYDGFGPQDVAAFRAAYGEVVETMDSQLVPVTDIPKILGRKGWLDISKDDINSLGIKNYAFCTDEDVGLTPTCQRFDEGTTPLEIVENKIKGYRIRYALSNFPNERVRFDVSNVGSIVGRNIGDFIQMRQFLEESIYQLIQGADVQSVVMPNLIGAMRAMEFFQDIIRTPDASRFSTLEAMGDDINSTSDRFLDLEVNTNQGPVLLRGETKWLTDISLDDDMSRLRVAGVELDKVIALIVLTERDFGFPRYEAVSLRLAYPDIEKLVIDAPSADALPTISLLKEIMEDKVAPQVETALGTLPLSPAFKASTTEMIRFYAALGSVANLDVNGLEAADNNSTLFRVMSELRTSPRGLPFMTRLGSVNDLRFYANTESLVTAGVIARGAVLKTVIDGAPELRSMMAQLTALRRPEFAAQEIEAGTDVDALVKDLRAAIEKKLKKLPDTVGIKELAQIETAVDDLLDTSVMVDSILQGGASRELLMNLEQFKSAQSSDQVENPALGVAIEALFDSEILATPQSLGELADNRALESQYGTVFRNVETSSDIFRMLHPEYFR